MKKIFSILITVFATGFYFNASAQCTPPSPSGSAGLAPTWPCLNCVVQGQAYNEDIAIENFSSVGAVTVNELWVDTIKNYASGLSYTMTPANGVFTTGQVGCINITGTTSDAVGDDTLQIFVRVTIDLGGGAIISIPTNAGESQELTSILAQLGPLLPPGTVLPDFTYIMRVVANSGDCTIPDSCSAVGINDSRLSEVFTEMSIHPNPFNSQTEISFNSNESGTYSARLFDISGKEVYNETIQVVSGTNTLRLERGDLAKGVYMYTITDGAKSISKRVVIRD